MSKKKETEPVIGIAVGSQLRVKLNGATEVGQVTHIGTPSQGWVMLSLEVWADGACHKVYCPTPEHTLG
jgi:hypothetical protein